MGCCGWGTSNPRLGLRSLRARQARSAHADLLRLAQGSLELTRAAVQRKGKAGAAVNPATEAVKQQYALEKPSVAAVGARGKLCSSRWR